MEDEGGHPFVRLAAPLQHLPHRGVRHAAPENATGTFVKVVQRVPVKIVFDQPPPPEHPVGPGMSVVPVVRVT